MISLIEDEMSNSLCSKNGFQNNGTQRYRCRECKKNQQKAYQYLACKPDITEKISKLTIMDVVFGILPENFTNFQQYRWETSFEEGAGFETKLYLMLNIYT